MRYDAIEAIGLGARLWSRESFSLTAQQWDKGRNSFVHVTELLVWNSQSRLVIPPNNPQSLPKRYFETSNVAVIRAWPSAPRSTAMKSWRFPAAGVFHRVSRNLPSKAFQDVPPKCGSRPAGGLIDGVGVSPKFKAQVSQLQSVDFIRVAHLDRKVGKGASSRKISKIGLRSRQKPLSGAAWQVLPRTSTGLHLDLLINSFLSSQYYRATKAEMKVCRDPRSRILDPRFPLITARIDSMMSPDLWTYFFG